jgi:zinc protease
MPRTAAVDRSRLPEPGPAPPFTFPAVEKSTLPNGLRIWTVRHPQVPVVSLLLVITAGSAADPAGQEGLAAITADMLDEGTGDLSAIEVHQALARLGAHVETDIGADAMVMSASALSRVTDRVLALMADMIVRPSLREADFARVRQLRLHRLKQLRDSAAALADRAFIRTLYGDDPYGHSPLGYERTLVAVGLDDVRAFHAREIVPGAATLVAVGDCDHETIARQAAAVFADWRGDSRDRGALAPPVLADGVRLGIVARPHAPQSELRIGQVAAARHSPDYHALALGNTILGGPFVSRVNLNLREGKGLTYGARTSFEFRRRPGPFTLQVSVQSSATVLAIEESIGEIAGIRDSRPPTDAELALGIATLTRGYARSFETADQIGRAVIQLALYGLPDDFYDQFVPRVEALTRDDVSRAMTKYLDPARLTTIIVGDPEAIGGDLARLGLGEPTVLSAASL